MRDRRALSRPGDPPPGSDLQRLLARLAGPAVGRAQDRPLGAGDAALAALLDEIDETVMARRLVMSNAAGAELALDVCNRRLLRAGPPEGQSAPGPETLTYAGLEDLRALRARLVAFCEAGGAQVRTARPAGGVTLEQTGVAVVTLRQAWALRPSATGGDGQGAPEADADAGGPDIGAFRAALADEVLACCVVAQGAPPEHHGDPDMAARLATLTGGAPPMPTGPGPEAVVLSSDDAAPVLVLAVHGATRLALLLPAGAGPAIVAAWWAALGR